MPRTQTLTGAPAGWLRFGMRLLLILVALALGSLLAAASAQAHPGHDHGSSGDRGIAADHDEGPHDPADHSHPLGEDTFHEKASHSSLDVADHLRLGDFNRPTSARERVLLGTVRAGGIDLRPPVPPPLAV